MTMGHTIRVLFITSLLFLWGCTEEIDLKLDQGSSMIVIEGYVTNLFETQTIRITRSQAYYNDSLAEGVRGAAVSISDSNHIFNLVEIAAGIYRSSTAFAGSPGMTYTLHVQVEGQTFTSQSKTPPIPIIDSIAFVNDQIEPNIFHIRLYGKEHPSPGDFYYWGVYKDGIYQTDNITKLNFVNDELINGSEFNGLKVQIVEAKPGNRITLQMVSIPEDYYDYSIAILRETIYNDGPFEPAPANINGNIKGALGFFYARSEATYTRVIKITN